MFVSLLFKQIKILRSLKTLHIHFIHKHCITGSHNRFLISSLFISVRRDGFRNKHQESRSTERPSSDSNSGASKGATGTEIPDDQVEKEAQGICRFKSPCEESQNPSQEVKKAPIPKVVGEGDQEDNHSNQGSAKPSLSSNEEDYHSED